MPGARPRKNGATDARPPDTTAANVVRSRAVGSYVSLLLKNNGERCI